MAGIFFCDWRADTSKYDTGTLFQAPDLDKYELIFFDPLQFAINNGLRKNRTDLWVKEYFNYNETDYLLYLSRVKASLEKFHTFLDRGGIWIIRCDIPNSQIAVRKKSSSGSGQYTKTVLSPYFWLQEFIGKYDFQYGSDNRFRFTDHKNPLYQIFKSRAAECPMTQNRIPRGKLEIWGDNGQANHLPALTRVHFPADRGELFFIPRFVGDDENECLVKAFAAVAEHHNIQDAKPKWIGRYECQLANSNPYINELALTEQMLDQLTAKRDALIKKREETEYFSNILFESGDALFREVKSAFELFGFSDEQAQSLLKDDDSAFPVKDGRIHALVQTIASKAGAADIGIAQAITEKTDQLGMKSVKNILVANSMYSIDPASRDEWFTDELEQYARKNDICLIPSLELFKMICYLLTKSDSDNIMEYRKSLRRDILKCDSVFQFDERKYRSTPSGRVGVM